jgi:hypothetical protein
VEAESLFISGFYQTPDSIFFITPLHFSDPAEKADTDESYEKVMQITLPCIAEAGAPYTAIYQPVSTELIITSLSRA